MLKIGNSGQFCRRKPSRFDGLVDATPTSSTGESPGDICKEETLYKHYLQVIYTPVSCNHVHLIILNNPSLNYHAQYVTTIEFDYFGLH